MRLVAELRVFCPAVPATIASSLASYEIVKSKSYVEAAASTGGAGTKEEWMGRAPVGLRYVLLAHLQSCEFEVAVFL